VVLCLQRLRSVLAVRRQESRSLERIGSAVDCCVAVAVRVMKQTCAGVSVSDVIDFRLGTVLLTS
jgi:hypothetical protein